MMKKNSKKKSLVISTPLQLKALADPLRYRIFELLTDEMKTAKQMAEFMGMKPTRLYHHFGVLEKAGLIQEVETRKKRGTTEKYYGAVADKIILDPTTLGARVLSPSTISAGVFQTTLQEISDAERAAADTSEAPPVLVNRLKIKTTEARIEALQSKLSEWLELFQETDCSEGDNEYAITLDFYQISENISEEEVDAP